MMENPIRMDDLGVPLFLETPIWIYDICHMGLVLSQEMGLGPPPEPKPWWEKKDAGRPRQFFSKMRQICKKYLLRMRGTQKSFGNKLNICIYLYIFMNT